MIYFPSVIEPSVTGDRAYDVLSRLLKDRIIKDEFTKAMLGYQNGTYGGTLKSIMKIHADKYKSVEKITELNDIIQSISNKGDLK